MKTKAEMPSLPEERGDGGVRSVQVALDVLEAVAFSDEELGVTQIAERLGLTKGSVHRHLLTLVERGYLVQNAATTRYSRGPRSRLLAHYAPGTDLIQLAAGPMRELRDLLGHSVVLSESAPRGALVLSMVVGTAAIEIGVRPGSELPFHSSAQGKVFLAFAPRPQRERILAKPLPASTPHTLTDVSAARSGTDARRATRLRHRAGAGDARHQCGRSTDLRCEGFLRRCARAGRLDPVPARRARCQKHQLP